MARRKRPVVPDSSHPNPPKRRRHARPPKPHLQTHPPASPPHPSTLPTTTPDPKLPRSSRRQHRNPPSRYLTIPPRPSRNPPSDPSSFSPPPPSPPSSPSSLARPGPSPPPCAAPEVAFSAPCTHGTSYFEAYRGAVRTSNHTLSSLSLPPPHILHDALLSMHDPHLLARQRLHDALIGDFDRWLYLQRTGHALLLYGYGSKRAVLEAFATRCTHDATVLVVDAYNPTVSLRAVLAQVSADVLNLSGHPKRTLMDYVDAIRNAHAHLSLVLVVHNLDAPSLRSGDAQQALCALAAVPGVRLAASIDHVNAALLWDGVMYARFCWFWIRAHTFEPYSAEVVYASKPLLRGGGERQVEGAVALLKSLSVKARGVFRELARRQMGAERVGEKMGGRLGRTTFNQLFVAAKEMFLVADSASLQSILTELETHQMLECRRGADAASQLCIPLQVEQIKTILKEIEEGG